MLIHALCFTSVVKASFVYRQTKVSLRGSSAIVCRDRSDVVIMSIEYC